MKLSEFGFFSDLEAVERTRIERCARKMSYLQGETIITKGADIEFIYFIGNGRVKESNCTRSGKEIVYNVFTRGECFGLVCGFNVGYSRSDYVATRACDLYAIGIRELKEMTNRCPQLLNSILSEVSKVALKFSDKLYEIRALDVSERTRAELLRHISLAPGTAGAEVATIDYLPTHEEIANTIFTHREAVTREISSLIKNGVIIRTENNLLAANVPLLRKMVTEFG